jgi:hypothetical protein
VQDGLLWVRRKSANRIGYVSKFTWVGARTLQSINLKSRQEGLQWSRSSNPRFRLEGSFCKTHRNPDVVHLALCCVIQFF